MFSQTVRPDTLVDRNSPGERSARQQSSFTASVSSICTISQGQNEFDTVGWLQVGCELSDSGRVGKTDEIVSALGGRVESDAAIVVALT